MWIHDGVFDRLLCSIANATSSTKRNSQGCTQALTWCSSRFLWGRTPHCHTQGCRPHHPHACLHLRTAVQEIHLAADCPTAALAVCSSPLSCDLLVTEHHTNYSGYLLACHRCKCRLGCFQCNCCFRSTQEKTTVMNMEMKRKWKELSQLSRQAIEKHKRPTKQCISAPNSKCYLQQTFSLHARGLATEQPA